MAKCVNKSVGILSIFAISRAAYLCLEAHNAIINGPANAHGILAREALRKKPHKLNLSFEKGEMCFHHHLTMYFRGKDSKTTQK